MGFRRFGWLCLGLAGCFSTPPGAADTSDGSSGDIDSSGPTASDGVTTNIDPSASSSGSSTSTTSEDTTTTATESSSESSSGSAPDCPGDAVCFAPSPPQWDGPAVVLWGPEPDVDPECPPASQELWRAGSDPGAPCDCSACTGDIACEVGFGYGANGTCPSDSNTSGCQTLSTMAEGQFWMSFSLDVPAGAACESPLPGEPRFRERAVGCRPDAEPCEGGACLVGPVCISRTGEHECPPAYPDRSVLHSSLMGSDLSCDTCGCGDDASAFFCTEATVTLYTADDCSGLPKAVPQLFGENDPCAAYENFEGFTLIEDIGSVDVQIPAADCSSDRGVENASGVFVEGGPRTVCCSG